MAAGPIFDAIGRGGFLVNGAIYLVSFALYRWGVAELHHEPTEEDLTAGTHHVRPSSLDLARYRRILSSSGVWLLAPTWIALNAVIGSWTTQSVFQLVRSRRTQFHDQLLMQGFSRRPASAWASGSLGLIFTAGLLYWGNRFKQQRRTTIIAIGVVGALVMLIATFGLNHSGELGLAVQLPLGAVAAAGLFVHGRRHARRAGVAGRHDREPPRRPRRDHGPLLGLPGRSARSWARWPRGRPASGPASTGCWAPACVLIIIAMLPVQRLRRSRST